MTQQEQKKITQAEVKKMVDEMLDSENDYEFGVSYSSRMKENDEPMYHQIVNDMKDRGILISTDGPDHNVIKIKPPMVFTKDNADQLLDTLDQLLIEKKYN